MHDYDDYKLYINGQIIKLSNNENELLNLFINNKGHIVSKEKICNTLFFEKDSQIFSLVYRLKRKCKLHIVTISGIGYKLVGG